MGSAVRLATPIAAGITEAPHWRRSRRGGIQPQGQAATSSRATLPLCCHRKASPFWIILLLVSGRPRSSNNPDAAEQSANTAPSRAPGGVTSSAGAALFGRHVAEAFEDLDRVPLAQAIRSSPRRP